MPAGEREARSTSSPSPRRTRSATASTTRTSFMARHGSRADYGGWIDVRRADMQPVADAIGPHFDASTRRPSRRSTCSTSCSTSRRPRRRVPAAPGDGQGEAASSTTGTRSPRRRRVPAPGRCETITIGDRDLPRGLPARLGELPRRGAQARASPATSSAPRANGSPSCMPATSRGKLGKPSIRRSSG